MLQRMKVTKMKVVKFIHIIYQYISNSYISYTVKKEIISSSQVPLEPIAETYLKMIYEPLEVQIGPFFLQNDVNFEEI